MKAKKLLAMMLALCLLTSVLAGCGSSSDSAVSMNAAADDYAVMDEMDEEIYMEPETALSSSNSTSTAMPENQKIITTLYMDAETENMDPLLEAISRKVEELGGYMEAQDIYNGSSYNSRRYRYANMTIRIPAEKLDSFVNHVSENANIISKNTTTQNVTLTYIATESRIAALETEQTRLLAMAETMEDLLLIESRLTEVRTELEQVSSVLRNYDNLINYSTVHLNIDEVTEYTDVEEPETIWERISEGFVESLENVGNGLVDFFVFIIVAVPYLLPVIVIAAVIIVIIVVSRRRKKKKERQPPAQP